jgi:hypothetical protein
MPREIKLSGSEIALLKTIGLGGTQIAGRTLIERAEDMVEAEFLDTLTGLIDQGYVERSFVRVNPAFSRDLRDAVNPERKRAQTRAKRVRRS